MNKKALLVGINRYPDPSFNLKGCVNDVRLMEDTLRAEYGFVGGDAFRVLTDARATTDAILDGLAWLADGASPGDSLLFHYSGHGSQVPDHSGDEADDGLDEILCPYDLDWDRPLTDDHLAAACSGIPEGALLTVILDCCHSGTGLREAIRPPSSPLPSPIRPILSARPCRLRFLPHPAAHPCARRPARRFGVSVTKTDAVLLAACRDDQTSADALIGTRYHGAHTFYLCRALRDAGWAPTYRALVSSMGTLVSRAGFDQVPQLEGPARLLSSPFLESRKGDRVPGTGSRALKRVQGVFRTNDTRC